MSIKKENTRNASIDRLRGSLMLLVIVGHLILGTVEGNIFRYAIYAFHMPLFIGLSGYLINAQSLRLNSVIKTLTRYWWRMLFPFFFAYLFYTGILIYHAWEEGRIGVALLLSYIHTPYYHLWFIPTMVLWVLAFSLILKFRISLFVTMCLFGVLTLLWATVPSAQLMASISALLSKKVIYFFAFFLFGAWLRTPASKNLRIISRDFQVLSMSMIVASAGYYMLGFGEDENLSSGVAWLIFNMALIIVAINAVSGSKQMKVSLLGSIGRNSLPIYLWHVVPLFILKGFDVHLSHPSFYYLISLISVATIIYLVLRYEGVNKSLDRAVYGVS